MMEYKLRAINFFTSQLICQWFSVNGRRPKIAFRKARINFVSPFRRIHTERPSAWSTCRQLKFKTIGYDQNSSLKYCLSIPTQILAERVAADPNKVAELLLVKILHHRIDLEGPIELFVQGFLSVKSKAHYHVEVVHDRGPAGVAVRREVTAHLQELVENAIAVL